MPHVATVTIASSAPSAAHVDFPVYVNLADMPAAFWSTVANGGGDIRCFLPGGTELAREVVSCDTATDTGELWVKFPLFSLVSDNIIEIHADGSSADYAVGATYGRNAVWAGYDRVYHLSESSGSFVDSTGSGHDGTAVGNPTRSATVGNFLGLDLGAANHSNYVEATVVAANADSTWSLQFWGDFDLTQANWTSPISNGGSSNASGLTIQRESSSSVLRAYNGGFSGARFSSGFTSLLGALQRVTLTSTGDTIGDHGLYIDDAPAILADGGGKYGVDATSTLKIGVERSGANGIGGSIAQVRFLSDPLSADWIADEYANQSSPSTFYTATAASAVTIPTLSLASATSITANSIVPNVTLAF